MARVVATVLVLVTVGGCAMVEQMTWDPYPQDPVLVPLAEKEELGWGLPSTVSAGRAQAGALENFAEIAEVTEPQIEASIGREVEVTGVEVIYPDGAAQVLFRTLDEPVVAYYAVLGLGADGSIGPRARAVIEEIEGFDRVTVAALYQMAYREEFTRMREYLLSTYPQFMALPEGYLRAWGDAPSIFGTGFEHVPGEESGTERRMIETIYWAYRAHPDRTDAQWRELFELEAGDRPVGVSVRLVLRDPEEELTWEVTRQIATDMRDNPLFARFVRWSVVTHSNLVVRDRDHFHDRWGVTIEQADLGEADWHVSHEVNGGTQ